MGIINRLARDVYDKIAAGEVVERPASVIKELVENSIDAGADKIVVEIKNGGSIYMKVSDNGSGMGRDDAELSFVRHATSKICSAEDLEAIETMGFRGEALASISAVAQAELFTKRREDEIGTHIICSGGEMRLVEDAGTADGTTFIIKNLFYNVPARMKFLKKDATEAAYISGIMTRFILAYPEISFSFINNGKEQLFSSGDNSIVNSIYSVYGKAYAKSSIEFSEEYNGIRVYGAVGKGDTSRKNREYQSCFVNRRYVKSPLVFKAIEEAYKNQVMIGKYPMAVVNIDINPSMIDINVHPTKLEVKFSDESLVYQAVYHSIKNALYSTLNIPSIEREEIPEKEAFKMPVIPSFEEKPEEEKKERISEQIEIREEMVSLEKPKKPHEKKAVNYYNTDISLEYFQKEQEKISQGQLNAGMPKMIDEILSEKTEKEPEPLKEETGKPIKEENIVDNIPQKKNIKIIGQVFNTYIIAEAEGELLIVDQHAAHERLMYEKLKEDISKKSVVSQVMLIPVAVNLNPLEYALYKENIEKIEAMGFETEDFGDNSILVRSAPYDLDSEGLEDLIVEIIANISENKHEVITEAQDRLLYTIACKAAVKANHALTMPEQKNLLERVLDFNNINTCPHGRPITISMSKKELEKLFKRIV